MTISHTQRTRRSFRRIRTTSTSLIPPDMKHHRIPAPIISFTRPNLPLLIEEIEQRSTI